MSTEREKLSARSIPFMELSDGSSSSKTSPPSPSPADVSPSQRAALRFQVSGNAIVTGAAGTLGFAASRALLEHGLSGLMIFDVNSASIDRAIVQLSTEFPNAIIAGKIVDITDSSVVSRAVSQTTSELGTVTTLLCFAGVVDCTHALKLSAEYWRRVLDINTTGSFICAQAVAKVMAESGSGGSIVLTASVSGHRVNFPQPQVAYNVSKSAVIAMKSSLAAEWARYGVRVNSISPGYMDTILNEGEGLGEARDIWAARNPMGRMGQPEELTGAVVLLASKAGSYITGADIVIDGGQILF